MSVPLPVDGAFIYWEEWSSLTPAQQRYCLYRNMEAVRRWAPPDAFAQPVSSKKRRREEDEEPDEDEPSPKKRRKKGGMWRTSVRRQKLNAVKKKKVAKKRSPVVLDDDDDEPLPTTKDARERETEGHVCPDCTAFYKAAGVPPDLAKECSRHRHRRGTKHAPREDTPPLFWELNFFDEE